MAQTLTPEPVKYFVAVLWADRAALPPTYARLVEHWGALDFEGPDRPFNLTDYYEPEMGSPLNRRLIAFEALRSPEELAGAKQACMTIEAELAGPSGRRVNLDIGYLDHNKVVLASVKAAGQKIYVAAGVYADLIARYADHRYQPFPWTFPDFKNGSYDDELTTLRSKYLEQMKKWRASSEAEA